MSTLTGVTANETSADASTKLAEAIDDFLGDLEKKFKGISDEILGRLDDMAERCDRLEQEMILRENSVQAQSSADGGDEGDGGR
jgi:heat shock factor-binding protein 1